MTCKEIIEDIKWRIKDHKENIKFDKEQLEKHPYNKKLSYDITVRLIMTQQLEMLLSSYCK